MLSQFVKVSIAPVWKTKKSQPFQVQLPISSLALPINYQRVLVSFQTAILLLFFVSYMKQHYVAIEVGSIRKHVSS